MHHNSTFRLATFAVFLTLATPPSLHAIDASRVLVVYKATSPDTDKDGVGDSQQLANYYAAKRGVPPQNLLALTITVPYHYYFTGQYSKFYSEIVTPIKNKLAAIGPTNIDVILMAGELPTLVFDGSNKAYSIDNALMGINVLGSASNSLITRGENPYFELAPTFYDDKAHFSHAQYQYMNTEMYLVNRIGSNSNMRGFDQIDQSVYGDRYVFPQLGYYNGNAYVDSLSGIPPGHLNSGQPYTDEYLQARAAVFNGSYASVQDVDDNIAYTKFFVTASGLPLRWENTTAGKTIGDVGAMFSDGTPATLGARALFYFGWRNFNKYNNVWEWLAGSVGCDMSSSSTFAIQALKNGLSAASYVIGESGLIGHQRPNVLAYYLLNGYNFAEASNLATPYIAWNSVNEGDPLYAPMAPKSAVVDTQAPALVSGYPQVAINPANGNATITLLIADTPLPDVARATVNFGTTTAYGNVANSGPVFSRRLKIALPTGLGTTYHYQLVLTDPAGNVTTTGDVTFKTNAAPTVATPAAANPNPTAAKTTALAVLGADDEPESALTYTWSATGPAIVKFGPNGTNAAKNMTATFSKSGAYTFNVLIRDAVGSTTTSTVAGTVNQTATTLTVTPPSASVNAGATQQFSATVNDQFGFAINGAPVSWAVNGGGTMSQSGLFTAGATTGGPFTVSATSGNGIGTATVRVTAPGTPPPGTVPSFLLHSEASELSGLTNGSVVTPATGPAGVLKVTGTGSVNFAPATVGNGVYFLNCCANTNNAYYQFGGAGLFDVFDPAQGEMSFNLKSRQSWAQRQLAPYRVVLDVQDTPNRYLFSFFVTKASGRLALAYRLGSTAADYYYVPAGQEDILFGNGVTLKVRLKWDGTKRYLYLNDVLVNTTPYVKATATWGSSSTFTVGALSYAPYGGYNASDDIIDELTVYLAPRP